MESSNVQNRISELMAELNDCREDERNTQSQILEVISVAGTILGILFSASYLNDEKNKCITVFTNVEKDNMNYIDKICNMINANVTYARIMFWLSLLIFCTAFAYIIVLGTNNILRYYYIQSLEDRLHVLISNTPDDDGRGAFLHWNAFDAPIITRNINHITSSHTALIYFSYSAATGCAILFSIAMVTSLFLEITPKTRFDYMIVIISIILMLLTVFLFIRTSSKAKEVAQFAWDTAHENQKKRLVGDSYNLYGKSKSFKHTLLYLIYPKKQDLQKPILIILGFVYGLIVMDAIIDPQYIWRLIFILLIFDFMAYQARYQINDIRGLREDKEAGCTNRLLLNDIDNPGHAIKISFIVALLKIIFCVIITLFWGGLVRTTLLVSLAILFVSTLLYETARAKRRINLVFILVGVGYPLRFFVGFFSVVSLKLVIHSVPTVCFALALWAYGSFSSILAWTNEVIKRMQEAKKNYNSFPISYEKKHFEHIQNLISERYILGENHPVNKKIMPLREKGRLRDPWNLAMVLCMICLFFLTYLKKIPLNFLLVETSILVIYIVSIYLKYEKKVIVMCLGWLCIIGKAIISVFYSKIPIWYLLFSIVQIIITITYFVLLYQPQIKKIDYKQLLFKLKRGIVIKVIGEYAFNIMNNEKNRRK